MKNSQAVFLNLFLIFLAVPSVHGAYVMNVTQNGPNVVASGSGTINTAALTYAGSASAGPGVNASVGIIAVGQTTPVNAWQSISGPSSFGSGTLVAASSGSGNLVSIYVSPEVLYLPLSYVSGSATSGTATWNNTTIAALGLTPGTYTYTWGSGASADSLTLNIGSSPAGTPAPSSLYLAAIAIAILAAWQVIRPRTVHE